MSASSAFVVRPPPGLQQCWCWAQSQGIIHGQPRDPCPSSLLQSLRAQAWENLQRVRVGGTLSRTQTWDMPRLRYKATRQCQQREGKRPWLGCHRALTKPPITPLFMIEPENHPLKLGALENPNQFENKKYPAKSSTSKEKISREMRKYFELMESETLDTSSSVGYS